MTTGDTSGETVECFNCGRANPPWAQVCRFCGVPLRAAGSAAMVPSGTFPTDSRSLLSMGAAVGTIVLAVALGLLFSALNPTDPTIGLAPTPTPHSSVMQPSPSTVAAATPTPKPTPVPPPALPGKLIFGTGRNRQTCAITNPTSTFGPGTFFAHAITLNAPLGVSTIGEDVVRASDGRVLQSHKTSDGQNAVFPNQKVACFQVTSDAVIQAWGTGDFVMRVYRGDKKIAEAPFKLTR